MSAHLSYRCSGSDLAFSIFEKHDKDGSGSLDRREAEALVDDFCATLGLQLSARERDELLSRQFSDADTNSDGRLTQSEFAEFAATLDSLASSLGGATDPTGAGGAEVMLVPRGPRGGRAGRKMTLIDEKVSMGALFAAYDANQDHQLDVHEAVELLKATCTEMGITTEWVTPQWVAQQFRAAGAPPRPDAVDEEITVGQDEFQSFCSSIMYFLSALGGVSERLTPMPSPRPDGEAAAPGVMGAAEEEQTVGDPPATSPKKKAGCGCFG